MNQPATTSTSTSSPTGEAASISTSTSTSTPSHVPCNKCVDGIANDGTCDNCDGLGRFPIPAGPRPDGKGCARKVHAAIKAHPETWARMLLIGRDEYLEHRNCPCTGSMAIRRADVEPDAELDAA